MGEIAGLAVGMQLMISVPEGLFAVDGCSRDLMAITVHMFSHSKVIWDASNTPKVYQL